MDFYLKKNVPSILIYDEGRAHTLFLLPIQHRTINNLHMRFLEWIYTFNLDLKKIENHYVSTQDYFMSFSKEKSISRTRNFGYENSNTAKLTWVKKTILTSF